MNKSKETRQRKKETNPRNQKKAKIKKIRKEELKEQERDRERESEKGEAKKAEEKQRETLKNKQKCYLGKQSSFSIESKQRKETNPPKKNKTTKEGLGPSEVALWATSPDPSTLKKKQNKKMRV